MLTAQERQLLRELQTDFPVHERPYAVLAQRIGSTEQKVIELFKRLQKKKLIRYVATLFDLRALRISSSLVAMRVPANRLERVVRVINRYPNVSHNYLRKDEYNVWFTLSAATEAERLKILEKLKADTGISDVLDLKTEKVYKSRAVFDLV